MGLALAAWQSVEHIHFLLFKRFLGSKQAKIPSIVYHGIESFDSRRVMVDRMAMACLQTKEGRAEWGEISKALKDANLDRNKIAHYSVDFDLVTAETTDGVTELVIGSPKLRPSNLNVVSELLGRLRDSEEHNLGDEALKQYVVRFKALEIRLTNFLMRLQPRFRI